MKLPIDEYTLCIAVACAGVDSENDAAMKR